ncbi:hypothetical protein GO308_06200 [Sphingomonas sp. SFZ2018-12]|nr:hypothetical protein [Sphingomonas sp. SFZ2018-12]
MRNISVLDCDADGFGVTRRGVRVGASWQAVERVAAFKRDLGTVDLICIALFTDGQVIEVEGEMPGYPQFDATMHTALAITPEWKLAVMFPAFAANPQTIFERRQTA